MFLGVVPDRKAEAMTNAAISALALSAVLGLAAAAPAHALTFAEYSAVKDFPNLQWVNQDVGAILNGTLATTGAGVSANVSFTFLTAPLASLTNLPALFTLNATSASAAQHTGSGGRLLDQPNVGGGFTFTSQGSFVVGGRTYAPGTILLQATFDGSDILGPDNGSTSSVQDSVIGGGNVSFSTDLDPALLSFDPLGDEGMSLELTSARPSFAAADSHTLTSFDGVSTGSFSADLLSGGGGGIPESATWALMLLGFGVVGLACRRRANTNTSDALG